MSHLTASMLSHFSGGRFKNNIEHGGFSEGHQEPNGSTDRMNEQAESQSLAMEAAGW